MKTQSPTIFIVDAGRTRYGDCWDLQRRLWSAREQRIVGDCLLLTEHDHVYTIGKGGDENHLLASAEELERTGAEVFRVDRGGDITYHGPGQIVGYPILDLTHHETDIHKYLRNIEEVIIHALAAVDIRGTREAGMTGVWVKGEKIAAIGVKVSRWITMHGFALNVSTDLDRFSRIIPCGIFHKGVTSMEKLLGHSVGMKEIQDILAETFASVFGLRPEIIRMQNLLSLLDVHSPSAVSHPAAS